MSAEKQPDHQVSATPDQLADQLWRLNNLYKIVDKYGNVVTLKLNEAQYKFFKEMHWFNIVLKARQLGFSTFIDVFALDTAMWNANQTVGIIADNRDIARTLFRKKIKFPYDNLPEVFRNARVLETQNTNELIFNNNSSVTVGTSFRGDTCNLLHISEFGKICAKYPDKATEIVTGSLNTVHAGNMCFIESTAEGRFGYFYDFCQKAQKAKERRQPLTQRSFKFFFFPWFDNPSNRLNDEDTQHVVIPKEKQEYFDDMEQKLDVTIDKNQRAWYVDTELEQGENMLREHPSTPEEAFQASIHGAYYKSQFKRVYAEGRICKVPYQETKLVDTWWDLGMDDATAIWFTQDDGQRINFIDYFEASGEGWEFYHDILLEKGYRYGLHWGPHDLKVREYGTQAKRRIDSAMDAGIRFEIAPKPNDKMEAIDKVRTMFPLFWFDEEKCADGIAKLEAFRKEWDEKRGVFRKTPVHDENIHAADAVQTLVLGHTFRRFRNVKARNVKKRRFG